MSLSTILVQCPDAVVVANGNLTWSTNGFQTIVTYVCDEDYTLVGEDTLSCSSLEIWTQSPPTCGEFVIMKICFTLAFKQMIANAKRLNIAHRNVNLIRPSEFSHFNFEIQLKFVMSKWSGPRKILRHRNGSR